jgi:hypothetical protein
MPCGVFKYAASVFVAEAVMFAVAKGVPADAVTVLVVPAPVTVTVPD